MNDVAKALDQLRAAAACIVAEVRSIESEIQGLVEERSVIMSAPLSRADYMSYVRRDIANRAKAFSVRFSDFLKAAPKAFSSLENALTSSTGLLIPYLRGLHGAYAGPGVVIFEDAVYHYFGEQIAEGVERVIADMEWPESGPSVADRRALVADLDARIAELTKRRDAVAAQLTDSGVASVN